MDDIQLEKYKKQYEKVNDFIINKWLSVDKACKKTGISKSKYYRIKKKIKNSDKINQKGGNNDDDLDKYLNDKKNDNNIDNEPNNNIDRNKRFNEVKEFIVNKEKRRQNTNIKKK